MNEIEHKKPSITCIECGEDITSNELQKRQKIMEEQLQKFGVEQALAKMEWLVGHIEERIEQEKKEFSEIETTPGRHFPRDIRDAWMKLQARIDAFSSVRGLILMEIDELTVEDRSDEASQ